MLRHPRRILSPMAVTCGAGIKMWCAPRVPSGYTPATQPGKTFSASYMAQIGIFKTHCRAGATPIETFDGYGIRRTVVAEVNKGLRRSTPVERLNWIAY